MSKCGTCETCENEAGMFVQCDECRGRHEDAELESFLEEYDLLEDGDDDDDEQDDIDFFDECDVCKKDTLDHEFVGYGDNGLPVFLWKCLECGHQYTTN